MTTNPMPKAKTERLIVREIDGETLVYDRSRDAASCLNEFAARVWRECDGETSVAAIAAALGEDERAVWLALHQLTKAQLLTEAIAFPPDMSAAKSRREVAGRLGLGAAAVVASIVAPMPAQAASCGAGPRALHATDVPPLGVTAVLGSCASVFAVYERGSAQGESPSPPDTETLTSPARPELGDQREWAYNCGGWRRFKL